MNDLYAYEDCCWLVGTASDMCLYCFSTLELDNKPLEGLCPQPPHFPLPLLAPSPPLRHHPFFFLYRNWLLTGALQASLMLERNPGAAAVAAAMHSERMCAAGFSERIAFVTEETLSLMSLDGHEFSRDQKLPHSQSYPPSSLDMLSCENNTKRLTLNLWLVQVRPFSSIRSFHSYPFGIIVYCRSFHGGYEICVHCVFIGSATPEVIQLSYRTSVPCKEGCSVSSRLKLNVSQIWWICFCIQMKKKSGEKTLWKVRLQNVSPVTTATI